MNSPELVTGISVTIFLLTISKLPPTSIVPKSMSRARLRKSRLGLADITSKDGTLSSFRFESFLQYNKNIIDTRNVEYPKFSLYYFYKIYTSVVSCVCGLYVRWKPQVFYLYKLKMWDFIHKFNVLLFFVVLIHYSCKLCGISITSIKNLSNTFREIYLLLHCLNFIYIYVPSLNF